MGWSRRPARTSLVPPADLHPGSAKDRSDDADRAEWWRRDWLTSSQRRRWSRRAPVWDREAGENRGLASVVEAVVADAAAEPHMEVADLGCGTGQVTLPLARAAARVIAIDISDAMIRILDANVARDGVDNVTGVVAALEGFTLPHGSLDIVVSNYALHHLADADKRRVVEHALTWLRPSGRIVIGDMMFGRGAGAHDREIIREKAAALLRKGPGGCWRIVKGAWRFGARTSERPLPPDAWVRLLQEAGFERVTARRIVSEAWVVSGTAPPGATPE